MSAQHPGLDLADPARLGEHFSQCRLARGRLHRLHCVGEWLNAYLAPRFVSSLVLLILLLLLLD